jgi:hypothetical protein
MTGARKPVMKNMIPPLLRLVAGIALAAVLSASAAQAQYGGSVDCLGPGETRNAVLGGQILPIKDAIAAAGLYGDPLKVNVCRDNGVLVYYVSILDASGSAARYVLDARNGTNYGTY